RSRPAYACPKHLTSKHISGSAILLHPKANSPPPGVFYALLDGIGVGADAERGRQVIRDELGLVGFFEEGDWQEGDLFYPSSPPRHTADNGALAIGGQCARAHTRT